MKSAAVLGVFSAVLKTLHTRRENRRRERDETRAWLADWQCDKINASLRDKINYPHKDTVRIDITELDLTHKHKPTKDGRK